MTMSPIPVVPVSTPKSCIKRINDTDDVVLVQFFRKRLPKINALRVSGDSENRRSPMISRSSAIEDSFYEC